MASVTPTGLRQTRTIIRNSQLDRAKPEDLAGYPLGWMLDACRDAVQPFFDLEEWIDIEIYDPLIEVLERLLNQNGMYTRAHGDSIYVEMPYTGFHDL